MLQEGGKVYIESKRTSEEIGNMLDKIYGCLELVKSFLLAFKDTDFSQVNYDSSGLALGAGLFLLVVLLYKFLWGCNKFKHYSSGHEISAEYDKMGSLRQPLCAFPKLLLVVSSVFMLVTLADPYLSRTKMETVVESRERIELIDISSSMGWEYLNTGKSSGEITREAHLEFLKMRRGHNDRVSLWLFSTNPYKVEDFIIDDDVYALQAEDAPYTMVTPGHNALSEHDPGNSYCDIVAPRDMVRIVESEGATNLVSALQAVLKYFDREGDKKIKRKALLVVSDAAVEQKPEQELAELKKGGILTYFIHIQPNVICEQQYHGSGTKDLLNAEWLKNNIAHYGGKFYEVANPKSIEQAYADINKLETAPVKIVRHQLKVFIFQRPLAVAATLAALSILTGIFIGVFFEAYP